MTTTQLRLLSILGSELVTDTIEQLDVTLLWVLLHGVNEGPGHSTGGLCGDSSVGSVSRQSAMILSDSKNLTGWE